MRIGSVIAVVAVLGLAACGTTQAERAVSGGLLGAGAGATGAIVTGSDVGTGLVVGGLVGAAAGGLTRREDFDLGTPVWRR